jgi:pimeloyl-ACP methyl ester carboxylesterase
MHGWAGYRGQLGAFVTPLTEAGFRVVALDAPGHGESGPGRYGRGRALMPDFIAALRAGIAHYGAPAGVVAHSLGASAVAIATLDGVPTNRLVLISPVANVMSGIDIFTQAAGVGPNVRARMPRRIERIAGLPTSHFDIAVRAAEREELAPMLVIHDVSDKRVPFDNAVLVAAAWPDSRLESTEGLGHLRILSDPAVIDTAVSYLSRQRQLADGALSVVALPAECLHVDRTGAGPLRHRAAGRAPGGISVRVRAPVPARVAPFGPAFGPVLPRLAAGLRRGTGDLPEALLSRYYTRRLGQVSNYLP